MLEIFTILLGLILLSKLVENRTNIPFTLAIIVLSYIANYFLDLSVLKDNFHEIVYLMLPVILIPDVLGLSTDELKENASSVFFLAIVAVIISIVLAVSFSYGINYFDNINLFYLLLLFTPLMATDVISVNAIFSQFNIPPKLKLYAEGESLFNDITAMVIFFFIAIPLSQGGEISISSLGAISLKIVLFSLILGLVFGTISYFTFNKITDKFSQFISVYLMASLSFIVAEKLELSSILSVVVAIIVFKYFFNKEKDYKKRDFANMLSHLHLQNSNSKSSIRLYKKELHFIGQFANAIIFISIATVIDLELLWRYKSEIFYVFVLTTIIRYIVLFGFIKYKKHPIEWLNILSLAGMKGALAIIMIVSLSDKFAHKEMFTTVILGVVILSIFVYTILLMLYLFFEKQDQK